MTALLDIRGLSVRYRRGGVPAVRGVSLALAPGESTQGFVYFEQYELVALSSEACRLRLNLELPDERKTITFDLPLRR